MLQPISISSPRPDKLGLRVVCVSDTHGCHEDLTDLPEGDILLHAGDFTKFGTRRDLVSVKMWLDRQMLRDEEETVDREYEDRPEEVEGTAKTPGHRRRLQHCVVVNGNHESNAVWKGETRDLLERGKGLGEELEKDQESLGGARQAQAAELRRRRDKTNSEAEIPEAAVAKGRLGDPDAREEEEDVGNEYVGNPPELSSFSDPVVDVAAVERASRIAEKKLITFLKDELLHLQVRNERGEVVNLRIFGTQFYWPMAKKKESIFSRCSRFLTEGIPQGLSERFQPNPSYDLIPRPAPEKASRLNTNCCKRRQQARFRDRCRARLDAQHMELDDFWHGNSSVGPHASDLGVDVLISHGPCRGYVDSGMGCGDLARVVQEVRPRAVFGGHIHHAHGVMEERGVVYVNAAICGSKGYSKGWECVVVDI